MTTNAYPSRDPANDGSLLGMANVILEKFLQGVDDMLPARVVSVQSTGDVDIVTVVPMVRLLTSDGRQITRAQIAEVPVVRMGAGGFVLRFSLRPGDLGWLKANDRDISLVMQSYADSAPNTLRKHTFQDAVFIPDPFHGMTLSSEDAQGAVLQSLDGTVRVAVHGSDVKLTAGSLSIKIGPSQIDVHGPVVFRDAVQMQSTLQLAGLATLSGGATIGGIPFGTHRHTGVQTGSGTSGGPTT